ncbi:SdrD B-like domain-containing protein [Microbacterium sp. XT11]|uniref:SdrD B-like domain-containing protein n=1 Tax=Microbacterium sp. XT11 TaxID=367477 RepID=UPI00083024FB|nr:SdrD B-like domain-containing protein [Microbacterium sp. XT11]
MALQEQLPGGATLGEGIPVTYKLGADLTVFADFADGPFALNRNVVIRDALSDQISWNVDDADFLVLTDADGTRIALEPAAGLTGDIESAIAADDYVNTYAVSGRSLYVNIGKDVTAAYTLTAAATITALPSRPASETVYESQYRVDNTAYFVYAENRYETKGVSTSISVPKDTSAGVDDPSRFSKRAPAGPITVTAGTSATVPFTFTIGAGVGDAASSRIVDLIDHSVLDVSEETLPQIAASISGRYEWNYPLDGDTFDLSIDADGNLVIAPNAAFPKNAEWGAAAPQPLTGTWNITVEIPTHVVQGKQTIDVTNAARYEGDGQEIVYTSQARATATSYGNEMEVRKQVYDAAGDAFTGNLRVGLDADGALLTDEFIYRVELLPHGTFTNMVGDVVDVLPAGVEFVGFVAPGDVSSGQTSGDTTYQIPGSNLTAVYDAEADTVTLERGRLTSGQTVSLYFKVRVVDHTANVGITNVIGSSGATITPTNDYPLSLLKRDSTDAAKLITDAGARFSVLSGDQGDVVLTDLRVVDGRIVTAEGATPVVTAPGEYWLREDVAPSGYLRSTELSRIVVDEDGGSADVVLYNTPGEDPEPEKTYAIGDVTWIDADRDGVQDDDEEVLTGVTVELLRDGKVIASTSTDERGRYLFDELPAGEYRVRFTLTPEQQKVYTFTTADAGEDDAVDSDADPATGLTQTIVLGPDNTRLTKEYAWADVKATEGIDPTWDAGVVVRTSTTPEEPGTQEPGGDADPEEPGTEEPGGDADPEEPGTEEPGGDADPEEPGTQEPGGDADPEQPETQEPGVGGAVDPNHPGTPGVNELPRTGGAFPWGLAGLAAMLLLAGASIAFWRRRSA